MATVKNPVVAHREEVWAAWQEGWVEVEWAEGVCEAGPPAEANGEK